MLAVVTKLSTVCNINLPQVVSLSLSSEMANGGRPLFPGSDVDDQLRRIFKYPFLSIVHCPRIVCVVYHFSCCAVFDKGPTIWLLRGGMDNFRKKIPAEWFLRKKISCKEIPEKKISPPLPTQQLNGPPLRKLDKDEIVILEKQQLRIVC